MVSTNYQPLIEQGEPQEAHPSFWAPLSFLVSGADARSSSKPLATSSIFPEPQPPTKAAPTSDGFPAASKQASDAPELAHPDLGAVAARTQRWNMTFDLPS